MKTIVTLENGEKFEGFIPLIDQLKCFFTFKPMIKEKVLYRNISTRKVYFFDRENSCLIPIEHKTGDKSEVKNARLN